MLNYLLLNFLFIWFMFLKKKYYDGQQVNDGNNIEMENNINNGYQWD